MADKVLAGGVAQGALPAQADLMAACLRQAPDAAPAWGALLLRLAGVEPRMAGASNCRDNLEKVTGAAFYSGGRAWVWLGTSSWLIAFLLQSGSLFCLY